MLQRPWILPVHLANSALSSATCSTP
jgi:hypothetical protein